MQNRELNKSVSAFNSSNDSVTSSIALIFYIHLFSRTNPIGLVVVTSFLCHIFTFCDDWCRAIWSTISRVFEDSYKWRMFICVELSGCWWYLALKNNRKEKTARKHTLPNSAVGPVS